MHPKKMKITRLMTEMEIKKRLSFYDQILTTSIILFINFVAGECNIMLILLCTRTQDYSKNKTNILLRNLLPYYNIR